MRQLALAAMLLAACGDEGDPNIVTCSDAVTTQTNRTRCEKICREAVPGGPEDYCPVPTLNGTYNCVAVGRLIANAGMLGCCSHLGGDTIVWTECPPP